MIKKITIGSCTLAVVILLATYFMQTSSNQPDEKIASTQPSHQLQSSPSKIVSAAKLANQKAYKESSVKNNDIPPKPPSIADINHGVTLKTDASGNFMAGEETKHLFEFYLSAIGEEPLEKVINRIQFELNEQLQPPALDQALSLLKRYIDYKIELSTINTEGTQGVDSTISDIEKIKRQKSQLTSLRVRFFDQSEYQSFFEQEEIYDDYMISHLEITKNNALTASEKKQRLNAIEQSLPEDVKEVRHRVSLHTNLYETAIDMRKSGASEEEIYQIRAQSLGDDAAAAMAKLDTDRSAWQSRLNSYSAEKTQIENSGLSTEDQVVAMNELIDTSFSGTERVRVRALNSSL